MTTAWPSLAGMSIAVPSATFPQYVETVVSLVRRSIRATPPSLGRSTNCTDVSSAVRLESSNRPSRCIVNLDSPGCDCNGSTLGASSARAQITTRCLSPSAAAAAFGLDAPPAYAVVIEQTSNAAPILYLHIPPPRDGHRNTAVV